MGTKHVVAAHNEIGAQVALVSVQKTGSGGDVRADSGLPAGVEALQLEIGGHEKIDELGVSGSTGTACVYVGSDIVNLLAVLFDDDGSSSCSGIGSKHDSFGKLHTHDGGSCLFVGE